jgi:hypothetical protein
MFHYSLSPMMSHFPSTGPNRKDDGFRISDAAVERAVTNVMSNPRSGRIRRLSPAMAASIALILVMGGALNEFLKPKPCVSLACQLDDLSDDELAGMVQLMEEDALWEEDFWMNLY